MPADRAPLSRPRVSGSSFMPLLVDSRHRRALHGARPRRPVRHAGDLREPGRGDGRRGIRGGARRRARRLHDRRHAGRVQHHAAPALHAGLVRRLRAARPPPSRPGGAGWARPSPYTSLDDFLAAMRAGNRLALGLSGPSSVWHIAGLALARSLGRHFVYAPFPGPARRSPRCSATTSMPSSRRWRKCRPSCAPAPSACSR